MPKFKAIEELSTQELLLRRYAMRRRRDELVESGVDTKYGDELQVRRVAVWQASRATTDTKEMPLDELPVAPGEINEAQVDKDYLKLLADKSLSEMLGTSLLELDKVDSDTRARMTAFTLIEIEAELLRRLVPQFAHTVVEKKQFMADWSLRETFGN